MYYLFYRKKRDLEKYREDFLRVKGNIESGKTPVFNEMRSAKTNLIESFPYNLLQGIFMVVSVVLLSGIKMNDTVKIAAVLVVNNFCGAVANYLFTVLKHCLRLRLCGRLGIEPSENNIAVMESLEYQSV